MFINTLFYTQNLLKGMIIRLQGSKNDISYPKIPQSSPIQSIHLFIEKNIETQ